MTTVIVYEITADYGIYGGLDFSAGNFIHVKIDNQTNGNVTVELRDDAISGNLIGTVTLGPNLSTGGSSNVISPTYGWCDAGDFISYQPTNNFPYTVRGIQFDSGQCNLGGDNDGVVCDTLIKSITVNNSTTADSNDGRIVVNASSQNMPSGYSFVYGYKNGNTYSEYNTNGIFENVAPGRYLIFVSWNGGDCRQEASVLVKTGGAYGLRYQLEYDDIRKGKTRIDIRKKDYSGEVEEICGAGTPIIINYEGDENDAYKPIIPCGCELNVLSMYPEQFYELFTDADDQMFTIEVFHSVDAEPFVPAEMDPISTWDVTTSPTIEPLSGFSNDGLGGSATEWLFGVVPRVTINSLSPSKYLVSDFVAPAGQTYNFEINYQLSTSAFQNFNFIVEVVLFDSVNAIVGLTSFTRNNSVNGTVDYSVPVSVLATADTVKVGIRFKSLLIDFSRFYLTGFTFSNTLVNWTTLSPPTVTLNGNQKSNKVYTDYFFEPGQEYSFDYDFSNGGTWLIEFTDQYGTIFGVNKTVVGASVGNHTFIAPTGISRISISVSQESGTRTCIINSFLNVTQPVNETGSVFELHYKWFVLTQFYQENYLDEPNQVTILGADGLGDLKNLNFVDPFGNKYIGKKSYIQIISDFLKQTPLDFPIRSTINLYDSNMAQAITDDPISQLYFDSGIYSDKDADFVLTDMLTVLGAKIFQALGYWWIVRVEYSVSSNLIYREFTKDGVYDSYGSIDTVIQLTGPNISERMNFRDRSQLLRFNANYGSISITHDLSKDGNLIEGDFETEQIDSSSTSGFKEWDFFQGQDAMSWGYEALENDDGSGVFFAEFNNGVDPQNFSRFYTKKIPLKMGAGDIIKIKFDLLMIPNFNEIPYITLAWQFKVTDNISGNTFDFKPLDNGSVNYVLNTDVINEMYIDKFNDFESIEIGPFGFATSLTDATFQLSFYFHNHFGRDYDFQGLQLRFAPTTAIPLGSKEYYVMDYSNTLLGVITRAYSLDVSTEPDDGVNIIRPNDYHEFNNPRQWRKIGDYAVGRSTPLLKKIIFDNVQIAYYPQKVDPPKTVSYSKSINPVNKNKLSKELFLGDVPNFFNSERIYDGWLRLEDETPTQTWHRREVVEQKPLLKILLDEYEQQCTKTRKLTGRVIVNKYISYLNSFQDSIDSSRYTNTRFSIDDKNCSYELSGVRVDVGDNGEPPVDLSEFTMEFTTDFNA